MDPHPSRRNPVHQCLSLQERQRSARTDQPPYPVRVPSQTDQHPFPHYCTATPRPSTITLNCYTGGTMKEHTSPHYCGGERCVIEDVSVGEMNVKQFKEFLNWRFHKFVDLYYCAPYDITGRSFLMDDLDLHAMICLESRLGSVDVYFEYFDIEAALEELEWGYESPYISGSESISL